MLKWRAENASKLPLTQWEVECAEKWFEESFPDVLTHGKKGNKTDTFSTFMDKVRYEKRKVPLWTTPALSRDHLHLAGKAIRDKFGLKMTMNVQTPLTVRLFNEALETEMCGPPTERSAVCTGKRPREIDDSDSSTENLAIEKRKKTSSTENCDHHSKTP